MKVLDLERELASIAVNISTPLQSLKRMSVF